jgi:hypothetical protein
MLGMGEAHVSEAKLHPVPLVSTTNSLLGASPAALWTAAFFLIDRTSRPGTEVLLEW